MKLTTQQKKMLAVAGGVLLAGIAVAWATRDQFKEIYAWDETIYAPQGLLFTVRLPRGLYSISSPDLQITAQNDIGTETRVVMVAPAQLSEDYQINAVLVDAAGQPYPIKVIAVPVMMERNPTIMAARESAHNHAGQSIAVAACPAHPQVNHAAEYSAVSSLDTVYAKEDLFASIDAIYFDLYPGAPLLEEGWEGSPTCAPWGETWLRLYRLARRLGKYAAPHKPTPTPPPPTTAPWHFRRWRA